MHLKHLKLRLRLTLLALATAVASLVPFASAAFAQPAPEPATTPSLPKYSLDATIDYERASLQVEQTTRFRNRTGQPLDRAVFQVVTTYYGAFRLLGATAQGQPATAALDGSVLDVPLPTALAPGAEAEIGLSYGLTVPRIVGRFSAGSRGIALGNWFPILAPHRGDWDRHQYTDVGDAFLTEVADFEVRLTSAIPLVAAASGRVVEDNGTSIRLEALGVRDVGVSLSPEYVVRETQAGEVTVRAYTYSAARGQALAEAAARYLRWYGQHLAPYPYRTLALAEVDFPASYGGMEYPGLIFLSSALGAPTAWDGSTTDVLVGHEVAHQWFYSLVGNDQVRDPWLDEAFATYLPYYAYRDAAPAGFDSIFGTRVLPGSRPGRPLNSTTDDFSDDGPYFGAVYRQGARFLDELRQAMGDAAFEAALRETIAIYADKLASPRAVLDIFQRSTSANLNPLIASYFSYGAYSDPTPAAWRVEAPDGPWRGSVALFVGAEFPLTQVEVWLDSRRLYAGDQNALTLDLSGVEPGDYALLVRVLDHRGAQLERARRVSVGLP